MSDIPKVLESECIIRFPDCDPFDHLNNSRYIDYFLNAREDQLAQFHNLHIYAYAKETGCAWVVGQHEIAYLKPAFTMETVVIESMVLRWGERDILVEFRMWDKTKKKLKALMWTKFFYFNFATQKSEIHPEALKEQFKPQEVIVEGMESFEKRLEYVRKM